MNTPIQELFRTSGCQAKSVSILHVCDLRVRRDKHFEFSSSKCGERPISNTCTHSNILYIYIERERYYICIYRERERERMLHMRIDAYGRIRFDFLRNPLKNWLLRPRRTKIKKVLWADLAWHCHGTAMAVPWHCHGTEMVFAWLAMALPWLCPGSAPIRKWQQQSPDVGLLWWGDLCLSLTHRKRAGAAHKFMWLYIHT